MATQTRNKSTKVSGNSDSIFDEIDNESPKTIEKTVTPTTKKPAVKQTIAQVVTQQTGKSKKNVTPPVKTTKPVETTGKKVQPKKTVAQVAEEFRAKKGEGKKPVVKVSKTEEVDNKAEARTRREEEKAAVAEFNQTQESLRKKYHVGKKPAPKVGDPKDFSWRAIKEIGGVQIGKNLVFKTVHPKTNYAGYPDYIADPRGTGLELVRVKSLDNVCEPYEEMFKVSRKDFLKDAKNKKKFGDIPETEYYSVCSDRRFMHATSWGTKSSNLKPADQID